MNATNTTNDTPRWLSAARMIAVLLLVPALMLLAGCDSNDSGMDDDDDDNGNGDVHTVAAYDTTDAGEIIVSDVDEGGIGYEDADGNAVTEVTWTSDYVYKLDGFVYVNDGQVLNIEPGTMIKGMPGSGEDASALIVARGGQIFADGNPDSDNPDEADPIIFTAEQDDGNGLGRDVRGLWGGVILLGDAGLNSTPGETSIEGVPEGPRTSYGGDNDDHNVGVFRFVSIRHTGTQLGNGDEIQGLTLGGLGHGSTVEFVESYASDDDGFEWFGGTVNTRYMIAAWAADDGFDTDEGWRGNNQFWLAVQATDEAGRISEQDGGTNPETGRPLGAAKIANATYIGVGPGVEGTEGDANNPFIIHRDNNANSYFNSVFMDARLNAGLQVEDLDLESGEDSRQQWQDGELRYENNLWWNIGPDYDPESTTFEDIIQLTTDGDGNVIGDGGEAFRGELASYLRDQDNQLLDASPIMSIDRNDGGMIQQFNPLAAAAADATPPTPSGFETEGVNADYEEVNFYGAFGSDNWARGWTLLSQSGELQ